jgi:hypothetical protein
MPCAWPMRAGDALAGGFLVAIAVWCSFGWWAGDVPWYDDPDSISYQARVYEIQGEPSAVAIRRVVHSPISADWQGDWINYVPVSQRLIADPAYMRLYDRMFQRRWLVPAMAAAIYPLFGVRSLMIVSLIGYVLVGLFLYALLRMRFSQAVSLTVASICLVLPPVRQFSFAPMTDSFGLALELATLWAAVLVLDRGHRWLPAWIISMAALAFTRDATVVPIVATLLVAVRCRARLSAWLAALGVAAALPAPLIFGTPLRESYAQLFSGAEVPPPHSSWSYVLGHYLPNVWSMIRTDAAYPLHWQHTVLWYSGEAVLLGGVLLLFISAPRRDSYFTLMRASLLGAVAFMGISASSSGYRLELVFVPPLMVGLATLLTRLGQAARTRSPGRGLTARGRSAAAPVHTATQTATGAIAQLSPT